ncbi:hypothetical protein WJX75_008374 [Coccomyxa subellipsoidea]|uniref:Condensation domain-containing protein n=1 Tax=Coccomyxa subellipsoidea TaxID=248742 RepID=A0ABR2YH03_9CHLO
METRPLHAYEQICYGMSVGIAIDLETSEDVSLTGAALEEALTQASFSYPCITTDIEIIDDTPHFRSADDSTAGKVEVFNGSTEIGTDRLQTLINLPRTEVSTLQHVELHSATSKHQLILVFNHAGVDAPGLFSLCDCILPNLGRILADPLSALLEAQQQADITPGMYSAFHEFDATLTNALRTRCRNHDATVQGTVSAAAMVAIAAVEAAEQPLPQVICNLASKPAARGGAANGSGGMCLRQRGEKAGQNWLHFLSTEFWAPPVKVMASSVGVNPIRANYGPLRVNIVHMLGGSFDAVPRSAASTMTHAHTFDGRLCITFAASQPGTGQERAQMLADRQKAAEEQNQRNLLAWRTENAVAAQPFADGWDWCPSSSWAQHWQ